MGTICWKPTKDCKTVGDIVKALKDIPKDTPIKGNNVKIKRSVSIRYHQDEDNEKKTWISVDSTPIY